MKILKNTLTTAFYATFLALTACKSDDVSAKLDDKELITTVKLTYTNHANASDIVKATWKDIDGVGGTPSVIDNITLKANTKYHVTLEVLDEAKNPAQNKTDEIRSEGINHQFFYTPSPAALLVVDYGDKDAKNLPLGLATMQTTTKSGTGRLKITLKHQPSLKNATSTILTGETDIEVDFPVTIN